MKTPRYIASERVTRFFRSPAAPLFTRPWLDSVTLKLLERYFFPLSRLWALARAAEGDAEHFARGLEADRLTPRERDRITKTLSHFERARMKVTMVERLWHEYLFGDLEVPGDRLLIAEEMRLDARTSYNVARRSFFFLRARIGSSVKLNPSTPDQAAECFGHSGEHIETAFRLPCAFPDIDASRSIPVPGGRDYWLRFASPSPVMADTVYARVHEPSGVPNPPTLVFGHGICVEFDHYHNLIDEIAGLTRLGIRVVRPEAPWHGRRVLPGHFGGEQLLSTAPIGFVDFLAAQHREWAVLVDWSRRTSSGPVALGGSSLGAQTAKSIAMRAVAWPKKLQADALFLVTHTEHIAQTALESALSDIWNLSGALHEAGWRRDLARAWLMKLDPSGAPCMTPETIVSVTGTEDAVTFEPAANRQLDSWGVPARNRFSYRRGHFSIPLGMLRDTEPLARLSEVLERCK